MGSCNYFDLENDPVQVLLSTYNGSRFLPDLLLSIFQQDYENLELLVRDDGSNDVTVDILNSFAEDKRLKILRGTNIGPINSFFYLLSHSSGDASYFSFCDQDDVWLPYKIRWAIKALKKVGDEIPALYCSRVIIVDEKLKFKSLAKMPRRKLAINNALVENVVTGCTIVINKRAKELFVNYIPQHALMHDMWMYLVISSLGKIIYDPRPTVLYRQHGSNIVGIKSHSLKARFRRFFKNKRGRALVAQAEEFNEVYGASLDKREKIILENFVDLEKRKNILDAIMYALSNQVYRQSFVDDLLLKILIIIGYV